MERSRVQSSKGSSSGTAKRSLGQAERHIASSSGPIVFREYDFLSKLREFSFAGSFAFSLMKQSIQSHFSATDRRTSDGVVSTNPTAAPPIQ